MFSFSNIDIVGFIYSNSSYIAIIVSAIYGRVLQDSKSSIFKMWITFAVGTFFHEFAHFLFAVLFFGFPYKFSIIPHREGDSRLYTMGHVKCFNMRWYNVFIISLAPLVLLPVSYYVYLYYFTYFDKNFLNFFIWIFLMVSLVFSSIPSSVDIKNVLRGNIVLNVIAGLISLVILYILYYLGVIEWIVNLLIHHLFL